jgi:hypothetical protein
MESYKDIKIFNRDQITPNSVMLHSDMVAVQNVESNIGNITNSAQIEKINSGIINLYKVTIGSAAGQAFNVNTTNANKFLISIDNEIEFYMQRQTGSASPGTTPINYGLSLWPILKSGENNRAISMRYTAYRNMSGTTNGTTTDNCFKLSRHNATINFPGISSTTKGNYVYINTGTVGASSTATTSGIRSTEVTDGAFLVLDAVSDYTASRGNPKRYEITIQFTDNTTTFLVGIRKLA